MQVLLLTPSVTGCAGLVAVLVVCTGLVAEVVTGTVEVRVVTLWTGRVGCVAVLVVSVDEPVPEDVLARVRRLPLVVQATPLQF